MKSFVFVFIALTIFLVLSLYFIYKKGVIGRTETSFFNESIPKTSKNETIPPPPKPKETLTPNQTLGITPSESAEPTLTQTISQKNITKVITLEIVDICSGRMEEITSITEGLQICLNEKYPYYIILEINSTHLKTSFYGGAGFNETYDFSNDTLIFFIFVEDIASVSKEIDHFYISGDFSEYFYLGEYHLTTVWGRDPSGNLIVMKMVAALPLYVKTNLPETQEWKELKFYLKTPTGEFYLGNLWLFSTRK